MSDCIGEIAALLTALCWSFNSVVFTLAGRRVGATAVNALRLWAALPALMLLHAVRFATPLPWDIEPPRLLWLAASGLVGFVAGDAMLFESFLLIGPRLAMLIALLVPLFGAFLAWSLLGETLSALQVGAMAVILGGVAWVVAERSPQGGPGALPEKRRLGIWLAVGGAAGQAVGLLLSSKGLAGGFSPISATLVRVGAAGLVLALIDLLRGRLRGRLRQALDGTALLQITAGALTGPVLGVTLSLVAIAHAPIGVASTLMSLTPVMLLPVSHFLFRDKITSRAIAGTAAALLGVALLFTA